MLNTGPVDAVIFSFNRGRLLQNCVESLRTFAPNLAITVFDDHSTDARTLQVLAGLERSGVRVLRTNRQPADDSPAYTVNGGLHRNIQAFVDVHAESRLVLLLQDDTQFVRHVTAEDWAIVDALFDGDRKLAFVCPAFLSHDSYEEFVEPSSLAPGRPSFAFRPDYEYSGYFDICIAHVERLRAARFRFGNEFETALSARSHFGVMQLLRLPFVAQLPGPTSYRFRNRTVSQRIWEWRRTGLYPVDSLSSAEIDRILAENVLPTSERFLKSATFWGTQPWPHGKLEGAPAVVQLIDRFEERVRRTARQLLKRIWRPRDA